MTKQELREGIFKLADSQAYGGFLLVDQILALIKEAGYVKLADDWGLPDGFAYKGCGDREYTQYCAGQTDMLKEGWRKVEIWKSP